MKTNLQPISYQTWERKYQLKTTQGEPIDLNPEDTLKRVARTLSEQESIPNGYYEIFLNALNNGAIPAGRILANAGAKEHKHSTSLINCTVAPIIPDSIEGISDVLKIAATTLKYGCGIGYCFSTLRPKGAVVAGAGAQTSGPLPFMDIFDSMCASIASAGGRRGAQMATFDVRHPDILDFIEAKRQPGRFRMFNVSVLITDKFMQAVKEDKDWNLIFPVLPAEQHITDIKTVSAIWPRHQGDGYTELGINNEVLCRVYKTVKAVDLWNKIMQSAYDYAEPGVLFVDTINQANPNQWCENILATNPCGEQPLPPNGSCLLGSIDLTNFVVDPFGDQVCFNWNEFRHTVRIFTRMLDNVVDLNGLPVKEQAEEIKQTRRHGLGITGLGSAITMLKLRYDSSEAKDFAFEVGKSLACESYQMGIHLAKSKGCAPILQDRENREKFFNTPYMQDILECIAATEGHDIYKDALNYGCRFTHATSIAPTGTISLTYGNNVSNGIEPSFQHKYIRNVLVEGKKTKQPEKVYSYEALLYKKITGSDKLPDYFTTAHDISPHDHVTMVQTMQQWIDSSISKTVNVPSDFPFEDFKLLYQHAHALGLKGVAVFRPNPTLMGEVLVTEKDLANRTYIFNLENGETVSFKGNEKVWYENEEHSVATLAEAIRENQYGTYLS